MPGRPSRPLLSLLCLACCLALLVLPRLARADDCYGGGLGYFLSSPYVHENLVDDARARRVFAKARPPAPLRLRARAAGEPVDPALLEAEVLARRGQLPAALERYEQAWRIEQLDDPLPLTARVNLHLLATGYGRRRPSQATSVLREGRATRAELAAFWDLRGLLPDDDARLHHARIYLQRALPPRTREEHEARALAELTAAELLWARACPQGARQDGLCATRRALGWRTRCDYVKDVLEVIPRDPGDLREADAHRERARRLARRAARRFGDSDALRRVRASARFLESEAEFEAYFAIPSPRGLSFDVDYYKHDAGIPRWEREYQEQCRNRQRSQRLYYDFLLRANERLNALARRYLEIITLEDPQTVLAVHARAAQMLIHFNSQLVLASREVTPEEREQWMYAHCGEGSWELEEQAHGLLTRCLELATEHHYFDRWARMCEAQLQEWDPDRYPELHELFDGGPPAPATAADVVTELGPARFNMTQ